MLKRIFILEKLHYIDVAKGFLILMVIVGHMNNVADSLSLDGRMYDAIGYMEQFWGPFFMANFFVITGFCSSFKKDFKSFFISNVKSLMIPAYAYAIVYQLVVYGFCESATVFSVGKSLVRIILFGSVPWFLSALFVDKIIYFFLQKMRNFISIVSVSIVLSFLGLFLWNFFELPRIWNFQHAMILLPFLALGSWLRRYNRNMNLTLLFLMYAVPWSVLFFLQIPIPLMSNSPKINLLFFPLWLYLATVGSLLTLCFCEKILRKNLIVEFLGKNSLVFYVLHYNFLELFFPILLGITIPSVFWGGAVLLLTLLCSAFCVYLLNLKYLKFIVGRR